jgi:hypothetical protein
MAVRGLAVMVLQGTVLKVRHNAGQALADD